MVGDYFRPKLFEYALQLALIGQTSRDVATSIADGTFGVAEETGTLMHRAIRQGARDGLGYGEALGRFIAEAEDFQHREESILCQGYRLAVPVTLHVALGTDAIHQHPACDFAALGWASGQDFKVYCAAVADLEGGVLLNFSSAVLGPEVFLRALAIVRNLGHKVERFTTVPVVPVPKIGGVAHTIDEVLRAIVPGERETQASGHQPQ